MGRPHSGINQSDERGILAWWIQFRQFIDRCVNSFGSARSDLGDAVDAGQLIELGDLINRRSRRPRANQQETCSIIGVAVEHLAFRLPDRSLQFFEPAGSEGSIAWVPTLKINEQRRVLSGHRANLREPGRQTVLEPEGTNRAEHIDESFERKALCLWRRTPVLINPFEKRCELRIVGKCHHRFARASIERPQTSCGESRLGDQAVQLKDQDQLRIYTKRRPSL